MPTCSIAVGLLTLLTLLTHFLANPPLSNVCSLRLRQPVSTVGDRWLGCHRRSRWASARSRCKPPASPGSPPAAGCACGRRCTRRRRRCSSIGRSCFGPANQAVAAVALVWVVAGGVAFLLAVRRHPDVMIDEAGPLPPPGVRRGEGKRVVAREELVADRLADSIGDAAD